MVELAPGEGLGGGGHRQRARPERAMRERRDQPRIDAAGERDQDRAATAQVALDGVDAGVFEHAVMVPPGVRRPGRARRRRHRIEATPLRMRHEVDLHQEEDAEHAEGIERNEGRGALHLERRHRAHQVEEARRPQEVDQPHPAPDDRRQSARARHVDDARGPTRGRRERVERIESEVEAAAQIDQPQHREQSDDPGREEERDQDRLDSRDQGQGAGAYFVLAANC